MDAARGTCGRKKEKPKGFWWGNLEKMNHLYDLGLDDRMKLKCNSNK
jgi:hypothetical protein